MRKNNQKKSGLVLPYRIMGYLSLEQCWKRLIFQFYIFVSQLAMLVTIIQMKQNRELLYDTLCSPRRRMLGWHMIRSCFKSSAQTDQSFYPYAILCHTTKNSPHSEPHIKSEDMHVKNPYALVYLSKFRSLVTSKC